MVVLISGVSLCGYVAVRLLGEKVGGPVLGLLGGMVSSTATSMSFARQVRDDPKALHLSATVIQLANLVIFVRLAILAALLAQRRRWARCCLCWARRWPVGCWPPGWGTGGMARLAARMRRLYPAQPGGNAHRAGVWQPVCRGDAGGGG